MTNTTTKTPATKSADSNGLLNFIGYVPLIGSIVKAYRFGKEKDIVLAIFSVLAILGLAVFLFGYPAFLTIVIGASVGFLILLVYMTSASEA